MLATSFQLHTQRHTWRSLALCVRLAASLQLQVMPAVYCNGDYRLRTMVTACAEMCVTITFVLWLAIPVAVQRNFGLSCDQLVGLEVVLADGTVVQANKSKRMWLALRGAASHRRHMHMR